MAYAALVILTLISCILFEYSGIKKTLDSLLKAYKEQFKIMSDKTISDEEKQKMLLKLVSKQLALIGKLILGILLFIAPFLSLFLLEKIDPSLNPDILVTWWGLLIPVLTVVLYIVIKRNYGRIQRNR